MLFLRKRYYTWLIKAYIRQQGRTIAASIITGILVFFSGLLFFNLYIKPLYGNKTQKIGYFGIYTVDSLPREVLDKISFGLTQIMPDGSIKPAASNKWDIKNDGRTYIFHIRQGLFFHNGKELTADSINLNFRDVARRSIDKYKVEYKLKSPYSPFLTSVSKPIYINGVLGLGNFKIEKVSAPAGFLQSITLQEKEGQKLIIKFYPTQGALKTAVALGEVDKAYGISNLKIRDSSLSTWDNLAMVRTTNYRDLVVIFYNNVDSSLSNKKARQALNFALPENFPQGERTSSPIPKTSIFFSKTQNLVLSNLDLAKTSLKESGILLKEVELTTTADFESTAKIIASSWKNLGIKTKIKIVGKTPPDFQAFLYSFRIPKDPDQYMLWHSNQESNISRYKNLRIDKLLEDGRAATSFEKRLSIYSDFQKYLLDDVPTSFLYFPYEYNITRR